MFRKYVCLLILLGLNVSAVFAQDSEKTVIAHRGASGYLPEHTLESKVLAHAQGADYIEQDVVMTRDNHLVVLHDLTLNRVTDVAQKFPGRARPDGAYYVIDFRLDELRQLKVTEGFRIREGSAEAVYPDRFPLEHADFRIHTLSEEIELIQGLNLTTGREAGLYVEIKSPWFHHQAGRDSAKAVAEVLKEFGYVTKNDKVYLQTFDHNELKRIHDEILPALDMDIRLVQLIAQNEWGETFTLTEGNSLEPYDYEWMHSAQGLSEIARYADGIGPSLDMVVESSSGDTLMYTGLVERAHAAGLVVHPYTFRRDAGAMPAYAESFDRLLEIFLLDAAVDGVFTDYPDRALEFLQSHQTR